MTKLEMYTKIFEDKPSVIKQGENELDELFKELTWKETYRALVVLNWFKVHDKHRFLQFRNFLFYAGDIRNAYNFILDRYKKEMKWRGKRKI